jgi:4'-phosphopantetheinyl transferase
MAGVLPLNVARVTHAMNISDAGFRLDTRNELAEDEVHLWRVDLGAVAEGEQRWRQILSEEERARAARFHFLRDRRYFTATRALLRMILGSYADYDPKELVFHYSETQKPSLSSAKSGRQIEFNVSHSGEVALLAFTQGRAVGVDVEKVRQDFEHEAIACRFFSEREQRQLAALAPEQRYPGFFRCWTRKEAYIKAQGVGLSLPLDQFDVSLKQGDDKALLATRPDHTEAAKWSLQDVAAGDGYVGALCVRGEGWQLKF